jgi:hypothetical protein
MEDAGAGTFDEHRLWPILPAWLAGMTVGLVLVPPVSATWLICGLTIVLGALGAIRQLCE